MSTRKIMRLHGFTLVEMLILMCIVGILAAITFAVMSRVSGAGHRTACASNLRQLGLAFLQYTQDNNGKIPPGKMDISPTLRFGNGWAGALYPYHKSADIMRCPADAGINGTVGNISYAYNSSLVFNPIGMSQRSLMFNRLMSPQKTVLLCEISTVITFDVADPNEAMSPGASGRGSNPGITSSAQYATGALGGLPASTGGGGSFVSEDARHSIANFLCADGHVKAIVGSKVSPGNAAVSPYAAQEGPGGMTAAGTKNPDYEATFSPI